MDKKTYLPINLNIELTDYCNLRCTMCHHNKTDFVHGKFHPPRFMEFDTVAKIIHSITDNNMKIQALSPFWFGEPLMHPHFEKIIRFIFDTDIQKDFFSDFVINTNVVLFAENTVDIFLDYAKYVSREFSSKSVYITFSLDFVSEATFGVVKNSEEALARKVYDNLEYFLEQRAREGLVMPNATFQFVLQEENQSEALQFIRNWSKRLDYYGAKYEVSGHPAYFRDRDTIAIVVQRDVRPLEQFLLEQLHTKIFNQTNFFLSDYADVCVDRSNVKIQKRNACYQIWHSLLVTSNGIVTPCCVDAQLQLAVGDVNDDFLLDVWRGEELKNLRMAHIRGEFSQVPFCIRCVTPPGGFVSDEEVMLHLKENKYNGELALFIEKIKNRKQDSVESSGINAQDVEPVFPSKHILRIYDFYVHKDHPESTITAQKKET